MLFKVRVLVRIYKKYEKITKPVNFGTVIISKEVITTMVARNQRDMEIVNHFRKLIKILKSKLFVSIQYSVVFATLTSQNCKNRS